MRDNGWTSSPGKVLGPVAAYTSRPRRAALRRWHARMQPRHVERYLRDAPRPKLHLGAGHHRLEGWLDTDRDPSSGAVYLDATARLPFAEATFHQVFSEHLIEHLPYAAGLKMLHEARRVLHPGGRIRTATPDLATITSLLETAPAGGIGERYAEWLASSYFPEHHGPPAAFAINQAFRGWGHAFLYDEPTLRATLGSAGFVGVRRLSFGVSDDPELAGLEDHGVADGNEELTAFETMVIEATRP